MKYAAKPKRLVKNALLRCRILQVLSRFVPPGVVILRYHSIQHDSETSAKTIGSGIIHSASAFEEHMALLARRFDPVTLDDILQFLRGKKRLPKRAVAITFDDGFRDNCEIAAPILGRYGLRAAFYITVGSVYPGNPPWFCRLRHAFLSTLKRELMDPVTGRTWDLSDIDDRRKASRRCASLVGQQQEEAVCSIERALDVDPLLPEDHLMMNWDQVRALHQAGHIIGSHTMTHPNAAHAPIDGVRNELEESRNILEQQLGAPVIHLSYPSPILQPHWTEATVSLAEQSGYKTAVTCNHGPARFGHNPLSLPRIGAPVVMDDFRWAVESALVGRAVPRRSASEKIDFGPY